MIRTLNGLGSGGSSGSSTNNIYVNTLENGEAIESRTSRKYNTE